MIKTLFPFLLLSGLFLVSCRGSDDEVKPVTPAGSRNPDKAKLLQLVNEARSNARSCGTPVPGVVWNDTLALVARKHSEDMATNDKLSHIGSDGSMLDDRLARYGYVWSDYAENVLKGVETEEAAIQLWLESPAHCENIMRPGVKQMGVGISGAYWTMVLASH
jgi:uncharacterized protein YkwD